MAFNKIKFSLVLLILACEPQVDKSSFKSGPNRGQIVSSRGEYLFTLALFSLSRRSESSVVGHDRSNSSTAGSVSNKFEHAVRRNLRLNSDRFVFSTDISCGRAVSQVNKLRIFSPHSEFASQRREASISPFDVRWTLRDVLISIEAPATVKSPWTRYGSYFDVTTADSDRFRHRRTPSGTRSPVKRTFARKRRSRRNTQFRRASHRFTRSRGKADPPGSWTLCTSEKRVDPGVFMGANGF